MASVFLWLIESLTVDESLSRLYAVECLQRASLENTWQHSAYVLQEQRISFKKVWDVLQEQRVSFKKVRDVLQEQRISFKKVRDVLQEQRVSFKKVRDVLQEQRVSFKEVGAQLALIAIA